MSTPLTKTPHFRFEQAEIQAWFERALKEKTEMRSNITRRVELGKFETLCYIAERLPKRNLQLIGILASSSFFGLVLSLCHDVQLQITGRCHQISSTYECVTHSKGLPQCQRSKQSI